jgi:hypothetical protein
VLDPWLQDKWADRIDNDDRVLVLRCDRLDQRVAIKPCCEVLPVRVRILLLSIFSPERPRGCLPVARISVHCDVALARVGLQEHNRNVLFYGCRCGSSRVEVVEEPRKRRMIDAGTRLERLVWLYYPIQRRVINKAQASYPKNGETKDAPRFCK